MAATSTTDVQYLSKVIYSKGYKDKDLYYNLPLTADMKKEKGFASARGIEVAVDYALSNGIGGTMAGAIANATATAGATFTVPQVHQYGYAYLDGTVMRNAEAGGDDTAFINYAKKQFNDGLHALMAEVERQAFRSKTGSIARITVSGTAPTTNSTLYLEQSTDCIFFRAGMLLRFSATDGSALRTGTLTVSKVDPSAGTITVVEASATGTVSGLTNGDYIYRSTLASDNSTGNGGFAGLGDWNPITPSSSFCGVNQTLNPAMLSGTRTTDTSNVETIFLRAKALAMGQVGAGFKTGKIYLHPHQFYNLVASKLGAIQLDNSRTVELGINSMKLGQFTFVEAPFADVRYAHIVGEGNLEMHTCGNQPTIGKAFDDPDTDQTKVKLNLDGNLLTYAPCQNVRVKLPSVTIS